MLCGGTRKVELVGRVKGLMEGNMERTMMNARLIEIALEMACASCVKEYIFELAELESWGRCTRQSKRLNTALKSTILYYTVF